MKARRNVLRKGQLILTAVFLIKRATLMRPQLVEQMLRDWSLITGRGGLQNGRGGGHVKFDPYEKGGGGGKSFKPC